tara:strand:+ start:267 stop:914 length:648 start_codon:yes stop_codon:yes gene_type:complete
LKKIQLWIGDELSDEYMLVDDEDYEMIMEAPRSYTKTGKLRKQSGKWRLFQPTPNLKYGVTYSGPYTDRSNGRSQAFVHRLIMGFPEGMDVDHINGNGLDNRRENLRVCTRSQNAMNKKLRSDSTTGYKGVYKCKPTVHRKKYVSKKTGEVTYHESTNYYKNKPYVTRVGIPGTSGKKKTVGYFATAEEAGQAYNDYVIKEFGEFAYLNEIKEKK